ncbi:MAG: ATP synthase F1 subunit epsilon [Candidatus Marinimicrobia bacterium]|jgi:F-type H+-transporting ATPase subunit epsilon|nr:ATP synthase F1 subunit epsilon [Candidatus Neomarinimicrobiota bacterium]MDP6615398.1 ATP synthase F1 subunit epsilon [Candidatus Neomarinimicrobiota bacterium]|tara:strand:- start:1841 stop:2239 length:399 start_codon:yes stop_codon:yes gene_type:complete
MSTFQFEIVTPTRTLDKGQVNYVRCPGMDGSFGVMANHLEGIIALSIGEIKVTIDGKEEYLATSGGYTEITDEKMQLLVESVEDSDEIDTDRAKRSLDRAQVRKEKHSLEIDGARVELSLDRALNRLRVARR